MGQTSSVGPVKSLAFLANGEQDKAGASPGVREERGQESDGWHTEQSP